MDLFSLEENDDCNELFITQSLPSESVINVDNNNVITSNLMDFGSPCVSLLPKSLSTVQQYSDISDDDFEIPCSQMDDQEER